MPEPTLICQSPAMIELGLQIERVASTNLSVLIAGETGVGKEVVAHEIHRQRSLAQGRTGEFIVVDCTNLPSACAESLLLGGAPGPNGEAGVSSPFDAGANGTVVLDEIGEIPLILQSKFLRVVHDRKV
jgi:transcriptional regulator with GAF, ATPase, and Fis domain